MKLILIGIQGSGKSTQGNLLSEKLNLPYLSTGHIFRELSKEKTPAGRYIKETVNAGYLVPDEKVFGNSQRISIPPLNMKKVIFSMVFPEPLLRQRLLRMELIK